MTFHTSRESEYDITAGNAAATADDLDINRLAMDAAKAKAQARELYDLASKLSSELPDDDLPAQIAHARDSAAVIGGLAERIERAVHDAVQDRGQKRRPLDKASVSAMSQKVGHMMHVVESEKVQLQHSVEGQHAHRSAERAHADPAAHVIAKVEKVVTEVKRVIAKPAAAAGAVGATASTVKLTKTAVEPHPVVQLAKEVKASLVTGYQHAKTAAKTTWQAVKESDSYQAIQSFVAHPLDNASQAFSKLVDGVSEVSSVYVIMPAKQVAASIREAAAETKQTVVGWARSARKTIVALWQGEPEPVVKLASKPALPRPAVSAIAHTANEGVLALAMQQAAAIGVALKLQGQGVASSLLEVSHQMLPNLSSISSHLPGLH